MCLFRKKKEEVYSGHVKSGPREEFPQKPYQIRELSQIGAIHNIKLMSEYARAKLKGIKPFEIRFNDRNYRVGDFIQYTVPDDEILNQTFKDLTYRIVYITDYAQKDGYIVFAEELIKFRE